MKTPGMLTFRKICATLCIALALVFTGAGAVAVDTWQHVAGTWDGSELNIYVNGTLMGTTTGVVGASFTSTTNSILIGSNAINEDFVGSIDEVRIWSVTRSLTAIQSSMNCTADQESPGLLAYYNFNEGTPAGTNSGNTTVHDVTGHNYNGTLLNFSLSGASSNYDVDARNNYLSLQSSIGSVSDADRLANEAMDEAAEQTAP